MNFEVTYSLKELANAIGAVVKGDGNCKIHNIASIVNAKPGEITLLADRRYKKYLKKTRASALLLDKKFSESCSMNALVMSDAKLGFVKLLTLFRPEIKPSPGIHPTAIIGENCQIDPTVTVGAYAVIEDGTVIGARTIIGSGTSIGRDSQLGSDCCFYNRVTLYHHTIVGDRSIFHSGVVIGADGFGLVRDAQNQWIKIPQVGRVVIGNDVEIGANTTIDRGTLEDTIIGDGVKLDNLIMIGHNVHIGAHTAIAGCVGIAGSTNIGRYCMIGAGAGINGHIDICDNVIITGMGMIQKSITKPGVYSSGTQPSREWHKSVIRFWQLDELAKRLKRLERRLYDDECDGNQ